MDKVLTELGNAQSEMERTLIAEGLPKQQASKIAGTKGALASFAHEAQRATGKPIVRVDGTVDLDALRSITAKEYRDVVQHARESIRKGDTLGSLSARRQLEKVLGGASVAPPPKPKSAPKKRAAPKPTTTQKPLIDTSAPSATVSSRATGTRPGPRRKQAIPPIASGSVGAGQRMPAIGIITPAGQKMQAYIREQQAALVKDLRKYNRSLHIQMQKDADLKHTLMRKGISEGEAEAKVKLKRNRSKAPSMGTSKVYPTGGEAPKKKRKPKKQKRKAGILPGDVKTMATTRADKIRATREANRARRQAEAEARKRQRSSANRQRRVGAVSRASGAKHMAALKSEFSSRMKAFEPPSPTGSSRTMVNRKGVNFLGTVFARSERMGLGRNIKTQADALKDATIGARPIPKVQRETVRMHNMVMTSKDSLKSLGRMIDIYTDVAGQLGAVRGAIYLQDVFRSRNDGTWPSNTDATVQYKGHSKPMLGRAHTLKHSRPVDEHLYNNIRTMRLLYVPTGGVGSTVVWAFGWSDDEPHVDSTVKNQGTPPSMATLARWHEEGYIVDVFGKGSTVFVPARPGISSVFEKHADDLIAQSAGTVAVAVGTHDVRIGVF